MSEPLVSVLIPVYNAVEYLRLALQSILNQTYSNIEILIIDDGSTDGSIESIIDISDPRIRIFTQPNSGRAVAMNYGLDNVRGEFYMAQDADDISHPRRIELQVRCAIENPGVAAVFVGHNLIVGDKVIAPCFSSKDPEQCRRDIEGFRMPGLGPTALYRMAMVGDVRFDSRFLVAEDLDYILRIGERFPMLVLGECLYSYRVRLDSSSRRDIAMNDKMVRLAIQRACRRRGLDPLKYVDLKAKKINWKKIYRYREGVVPHFMQSVLDLRLAGRTWQAWMTAIECTKFHCFDVYYYKPLLYAALPLSVITAYRRAKANLRQCNLQQ